MHKKVLFYSVVKKKKKNTIFPREKKWLQIMKIDRVVLMQVFN